MIEQIASLGVMSMLGAPMLAKIIPKKALGGVVKKVVHHYLHSGKHLEEAMKEATEETFSAFSMALSPTLLKKGTASKVRREFVEEFKEKYLERFLKEHPSIDPKVFVKEASQACHVILKNVDDLIEPIVPTESAVHGFFAEGELNRVDERMNQGELELVRKINSLDKVTPEFLKLMRFDHLLFQALHYFFRQEMSQTPAAKAIFDELNQMKVARSIREARQQRDQMSVHLVEIQGSLESLSQQMRAEFGAERQALLEKRNELENQEYQLFETLKLFKEENLVETERQWAHFQQGLVRFETRFSAQLKEMGKEIQAAKVELQEAKIEIISKIDDIDGHLRKQDEDAKERYEELKDLLMMLWQKQNSSMEGAYNPRTISALRGTYYKIPQAKREKVLVGATSAGAGISIEDINKMLKKDPNERSLKKAMNVGFSLIDKDENNSRHFTVFFNEKITLGRKSNNDLVLYWRPLPDPVSPKNPEWQNWRNTGECHPTLNISGLHLELWWVGNALTLYDRSSKGTFINGRKIPQGRWITLSEGDHFSLANVLTLSYSMLRDENNKPIGWRLRRFDNYEGREEFLFVKSGSTFSFGSSDSDDIQVANLQRSHLRFRREKGNLFFLPTRYDVKVNSKIIREQFFVKDSVRFRTENQVIWCMV